MAAAAVNAAAAVADVTVAGIAVSVVADEAMGTAGNPSPP